MNSSSFCGMFRYLLYQMDTPSIVMLLILFFLSIICWALFFYKLSDIYRKKKRLQKKGMTFNSTQVVHVLCTSLKYCVCATVKKVTSQKSFTLVSDHLLNQLDMIVEREYAQIMLLAVVGAVAPLIGLAGTIWGLIVAFFSMSHSHAADILTIAPGVARAFLTTFAGLIVAIPAIGMHAVLSRQLVGFEICLYDFFQKSLQEGADERSVTR